MDKNHIKKVLDDIEKIVSGVEIVGLTLKGIDAMQYKALEDVIPPRLRDDFKTVLFVRGMREMTNNVANHFTKEDYNGKRKRKEEYCYECGYKKERHHNYCPQCGEKVERRK